MSKSLGNVLGPVRGVDRFGADALRFYLLREVPFGRDGSVSTASFEVRYETELANELGNLASRTMGMCGATATAWCAMASSTRRWATTSMAWWSSCAPSSTAPN